MPSIVQNPDQFARYWSVRRTNVTLCCGSIRAASTARMSQPLYVMLYGRIPPG